MYGSNALRYQPHCRTKYSLAYRASKRDVVSTRAEAAMRSGLRRLSNVSCAELGILRLKLLVIDDLDLVAVDFGF